MRQNNTRRIALCGVMAAVAVVIMCLGGIIPVATYVCPMLCCLTQFMILCFCGEKLAWTWFVAVGILSLILGPDKEAAMVFVAIGCYPMLKPKFESRRLAVVLKVLFFNISILLMYAVMIKLLGMQEVAAENAEFGFVGIVILLLLGNVTFFLLDRLLTIVKLKVR